MMVGMGSACMRSEAIRDPTPLPADRSWQAAPHESSMTPSIPPIPLACVSCPARHTIPLPAPTATPTRRREGQNRHRHTWRCAMMRLPMVSVYQLIVQSCSCNRVIGECHSASLESLARTFHSSLPEHTVDTMFTHGTWDMTFQYALQTCILPGIDSLHYASLWIA